MDKHREPGNRHANPDASPFVLLRYAPRSSDATAGIPLLVIQDGPALEIVIRPDWRQGLGSEEGEYLAELMDDWRGANSAEIPALLEKISELSIGPLQAIESGLLDSERRSAFIQQVSAAPRRRGSN